MPDTTEFLSARNTHTHTPHAAEWTQLLLGVNSWGVHGVGPGADWGVQHPDTTHRTAIGRSIDPPKDHPWPDRQSYGSLMECLGYGVIWCHDRLPRHRAHGGEKFVFTREACQVSSERLKLWFNTEWYWCCLPVVWRLPWSHRWWIGTWAG